MAIAQATASTNVWDTIYNHLQTGAYAISTNNIFSAWNSTLAEDKGYPLVIISPPSIGYENLSLTGALRESEITVEISVFHNNAANLKALVDETINKLITGKVVFETVRLKRMKIESTDYDSWEQDGRRIHLSSFTVTFRWIQ